VLRDAEARSTEQPRRPDFVNATLHYAYEPGKLYTVQTAPGFLTAIALRPGERLVSKAAGDTVRWEVGETAQGSPAAPQVLLLIKPLDPDLRTNMILTTDQRTYVLDLVSTGGSDHATLVEWSYPAEAMRELQIQHAALTVQALAAQSQGMMAPGLVAPAMAPSPFITPAGAAPPLGPARLGAPAAYGRPAAAADIAPASLNFDYRIDSKARRAPGWTPEHVFDDGHKTYVKFPADIATIEIPPLFMIGPKGEAELVNYRFENGYYVVDRLFTVAELRLGAGDQQVVRLVYKGAAR
jgi:type IV secretion system protein VirB9